MEVFFKGGTAIHLILHSPRFSEDLDFSTPLAKKEIIQIVGKTAEKTAALLTRFKGRDFFDLWFLLTKNIKINERLIKKKLGGKGKKFSWVGLSAKIKKMPEKTIEKDLSQFLPAYQRKIVPLLKTELLKIVEEKMR